MDTPAREAVRLSTLQPYIGHVRGFTYLNPHIVCLNTRTGKIKAWNINTNTWHDLPSATKSDGMQIVNVNNDLYVLSANLLFKLEGNRFWVKKAALITPPSKWWKMVSFQNKMYLMQKNITLCFDPACNDWKSDLPGCGLDGFFAATNNFIYALGGGYMLREAVRFDPEAQTWSKIRSMKSGRMYASAAVLDEKVYVTGGYVARKSVNYFHQEAEVWSEVADMLHTRWDHFSCAINNKLYVVGGKNEDDKFTNSIEVYDPSSNQWTIVQTEGLPRNSELEGCVYYM